MATSLAKVGRYLPPSSFFRTTTKLTATILHMSLVIDSTPLCPNPFPHSPRHRTHTWAPARRRHYQHQSQSFPAFQHHYHHCRHFNSGLRLSILTNRPNNQPFHGWIKLKRYKIQQKSSSGMEENRVIYHNHCDWFVRYYGVLNQRRAIKLDGIRLMAG